MGAAKRVTVRLPETVVRATDEVATRRECSRSALVEDALRWYLRVQDLARAKRPRRRWKPSRGAGRKSPEGSS